MNPYGILTTYEERMKANLQQYQRPDDFVRGLCPPSRIISLG